MNEKRIFRRIMASKWSKLLVTIFTLSAMSRTVVADDKVNLEKPAVEKAVAQFYVALNDMFVGDMKAMKEIWSDSSNVTYLDPLGGFHQGRKAVMASWLAQAKMKLGGKVETSKMVITIGKDIAVTHNVEKGVNQDVSGKEQTVYIRATNVFRKEKGLWKMIGHHTDLLPFLDK